MERKQSTPSTDIILKNQLIIEDIRRINQEYQLKKKRNKKFNITTYGCQMNEHDSEKLKGMLCQMGYDETDKRENSDLVIFNTCCVRENAELKVYGNLGHLKSFKRKNPNAIIAVCGCMMQQEHVVKEIKKTYKHVDLVFGTHNIHNFPKLLSEAMNSDNMLVDVWESEGEIIEGLPVIRKLDVKAFVNIMYGCNNFCTYCIVPYTRGRERSRDPEVILSEVKDLVADGVKEITLLGQNVNSYGNTFDNGYTFADLLKAVNEIEGLERIRFMTSHPKDISDDVIDAIAECEKLCEHVHLPVQSGSNNMLKAMNRKYTREHYLDLIRKIKTKVPNATISTDLIIGFPGETDQDIEDTIDLIKEVEYDASYTFIYSVRTGTPAAEYDNQIDEKVKHERFEKVLNVINDIISRKNKSLKDEVLEVLVEGQSSKDKTILTGRTRGFRTVNFPGDESDIGKLVKVKITNPRSFSLMGEKVE